MKIKFDNVEMKLSNEQVKKLRKMLEKPEKTLADVAVGDTFKIGDMEFIKFSEENGKAIVVMRDFAFESKFNEDESNNLKGSYVQKRLEKEILPKIEKRVGKENVLEFETDLFTLDGLDIYGKMHSKISLPTYDFYRANRKIFDKYSVDEHWWTATANSEDSWVSCVSPDGDLFSYYGSYYDGGVRPFLYLQSSIFVS